MKTPTFNSSSKAGVPGKGAAIVAQNQAGGPTMSSREIAALTGKLHQDVLRDIRRMLMDLGVAASSFAGSYKDPTGRALPMFSLPKNLCITLVSGYSVQMRHAIVTRWMELEAQQQAAPPALPRSFAEALRLAADQAEQLEAQRVQIEQQRPAVEFVERYVDSTGTLGLRQVAKTLRANERELVAWLLERGVMYRLAGHLVPMAAHMAAGRFVVKAGNADNGHAYTNARFTPKGLEWVAGEWGKRAVLLSPVAASLMSRREGGGCHA